MPARRITPASPRRNVRVPLPTRGAALTSAASCWRTFGAAAVRSTRRSGNAIHLPGRERRRIGRRLEIAAKQRPDLVPVVGELLGRPDVLVRTAVVERDV